jgi:putative ABC transport system substrate-binding protein
MPRTSSRRWFLQGSLALGGSSLLYSCGRPVQGPQAAKVPRIGGLVWQSASLPVTIQCREAFLAGLRDLGYEEGRNISVEFRYAEGRIERLPELAAELARLPVDIIVLQGDPALAAARQATDTTPIVFALASTPVESGHVASLSRPGGNSTGLTEMFPELSGKRLELLRKAVPSLARAAVLWSPEFAGSALQYKEAELAADAIGFELLSLPVSRPEDFEPAIEAGARGGADALVVLPGPHSNYPDWILELVARTRLPAIYGGRPWTEGGGLMSFGANVPDMWRRAATYVDKILKGAKPADLPVERPDRFEFIVNLSTARALGLTIPQSVLAQANEVIEKARRPPVLATSVTWPTRQSTADEARADRPFLRCTSVPPGAHLRIVR